MQDISHDYINAIYIELNILILIQLKIFLHEKNIIQKILSLLISGRRIVFLNNSIK